MSIYPPSLEILLTGAVRQLDIRDLRLVRKDGEPRIAIVCPTCKAKFTWANWSRLPKCGDGTTDPELLEPGEEPETRRCRCGSTITVDLQDAAKRGLA